MDPKLKNLREFMAKLGLTGRHTLLQDDKGAEFIPSDAKGAALVPSFKISPEEYLTLCAEHRMEPDEDPEDIKNAALAADDRATRKAAHIQKLTAAGKAAQVMHQERIKTFRASDESVDRAGDIVRVDGWDLSDYRKNPVFLDGHNYSKAPIGRVVKAWTETADSGAANGKSLMIHVYFPTKAVSEAADAAFRGIEGQLYGAVSVGFRPTKVNNPSSDEERSSLGLGRYGVEFLSQKLWEVSLVTVPANQNALVVNSAERTLTMADLAPVLDELKALRSEFKSIAAVVGSFKDSLEAIELACMEIITRTVDQKTAEGGAGQGHKAPNAPEEKQDYEKVLSAIAGLDFKASA